MLNRKLMTLLLLSSLVVPGLAQAQSESKSGEDIDVIEMEMEKSAPSKQEEAPAPTSAPQAYDEGGKENTMKEFQGLTGLAPFKEISVIQRRFMPKTGRFELFGGGTIVTNDPFFNTLGGVVKLGYFMTETLSLIHI